MTGTAASLVNEIKSVKGSDFLSSVRFYTAPSFGLTYLTSLDELLIAFHPRASTSATLNGDVVEIQGAATSGKTQLCYFLAITTALSSMWEVEISTPHRPARTDKVELGGKGKAVIVYDTDGRCDVERLALMVEAHLKRRVKEYCQTVPYFYGGEASPQELEKQVLATLSRIHIFRPGSMLSLAVSIQTLPKYIRETLPEQEVALVIIDSISAFYWQNKYELEQTQSKTPLPQEAESSAQAQARTSSLPSHPIKYVMQALSSFRQSHNVVIVMTNWAFTSLSKTSPFYRQPMPPPYPNPFKDEAPPVPPFDESDPLRTALAGQLQLTHHITLHPAKIPAFPPETTLQQVMEGQDSKMREIMVNKSKSVKGYLRLVGAKGFSTFDWSITPTGIEA